MVRSCRWRCSGHGSWRRWIELRELAAELAFQAAEQRDTPEARGLAVWGGLYVMVTAGAVDLARAELNSVSMPTRTAEGMQLEGTLALCRSFLAAVESRPGDVEAPLEHAAELAARTGEINAYRLGFGPQAVGQWRTRALLETGDHELAGCPPGITVMTGTRKADR